MKYFYDDDIATCHFEKEIISFQSHAYLMKAFKKMWNVVFNEKWAP